MVSINTSCQKFFANPLSLDFLSCLLGIHQWTKKTPRHELDKESSITCLRTSLFDFNVGDKLRDMLVILLRPTALFFPLPDLNNV